MPIKGIKLPNTHTSFDVTCVIGTVQLVGPNEPEVLSPDEAAMVLISRHKYPGVFTFPLDNGATMRVTVEFIEEEA